MIHNMVSISPPREGWTAALLVWLLGYGLLKRSWLLSFYCLKLHLSTCTADLPYNLAQLITCVLFTSSFSSLLLSAVSSDLTEFTCYKTIQNGRGRSQSDNKKQTPEQLEACDHKELRLQVSIGRVQYTGWNIQGATFILEYLGDMFKVKYSWFIIHVQY